MDFCEVVQESKSCLVLPTQLREKVPEVQREYSPTSKKLCGVIPQACEICARLKICLECLFGLSPDFRSVTNRQILLLKNSKKILKDILSLVGQIISF